VKSTANSEIILPMAGGQGERKVDSNVQKIVYYSSRDNRIITSIVTNFATTGYSCLSRASLLVQSLF
jgi:hypothetical protein